MSVVGIPGAGKTSLARRLLAGLGDRLAFYFRLREWPSYGGLLKALRDFLAKNGRRRLADLTVRAAPPPVEEAASALSCDLAGLSALLVLDDFHHASGQPELGHFVRRLVELLPSVAPPSRLLLLSCRAPDICDRRERTFESTVRELQLGGLDERGAMELARNSGVPQTALDSVYRATRGHPLSIRLLGVPPGSPAHAAGALQFIQEDVIGRIPPSERALLQLASALRRPAPQETLLALSDDPLAYDALSALVSRSLVTDDEGRYEVHEMVREGAYGRLPPMARKAVHMRAAALFLKNSDAGSGAEAVYHLCRAGEPERSSQLLLSLGGELIAEGRLEECRFLLDMVDPGPPSAAEGLRRLRQDLLAEYGEWDAGYEHLQQCLLLARVTGAGARAPGLRMRSEKEWRAALAEHKRGLEVLRRVGDTPGRCELQTSLGWIHLMRGEHREASAAYRQAGRHCGSSACRQASLRAGLGLGQAAMLGGDRAMAARQFHQVLRRLRTAETGMSIAALNHLALLAEKESELGKALDHLGGALLACGAGRHRRERAYTLLHAGQLHSRLGEHGAAVKDLSSALEEFGGIGDMYGTVYVLLALAAEALRAGELAEAERWCAEALRQRSIGQLGEVREQAARLAAMVSKEKAKTRGRHGAAAGESKARGGA